ncbi:hypothetical protein L6164_017285 [Bauhinia variegata]|uniref:Uncharacterized protein n=1 Tax=Bauhinia variegata TaxID=167791 RepID=A0ACB9N867_BAUVA|nr:hypothetical protein L6164_017285 [Bauhinia variegata]
MRVLSLIRRNSSAWGRRNCFASFCTDNGDGLQSSRVKIFDRQLKLKQRDRAAWLMHQKDSLLDTVAENLLDRLEAIVWPFL